jgi:hypothetical protein
MSDPPFPIGDKPGSAGGEAGGGTSMQPTFLGWAGLVSRAGGVLTTQIKQEPKAPTHCCKNWTVRFYRF